MANASATGALGLALLGFAGAGLDGQQGSCTVERIIDGDTLVCRGGERIRLLLIDAPETNQRPFGALARSALEALAPPGTALGVELDIGERDRYRRVLAYLYLPDGRMLNEQLVRSGYAVPMVVPPNVRYVEIIRDAARDARELGAGLWSLGAMREADTLPEEAAGRCHPSYPDVCIPPPPPDLDCADIPHRRFRVVGRDPHRFDGDKDGIGCERGRRRIPPTRGAGPPFVSDGSRPEPHG